jgi:hypothetical protein
MYEMKRKLQLQTGANTCFLALSRNLCKHMRHLDQDKEEKWNTMDIKSKRYGFKFQAEIL